MSFKDWAKFRPRRLFLVVCCLLLLVSAGVLVGRGPTGEGRLSDAAYDRLVDATMIIGPDYATALRELGYKGFNPFLPGDAPAVTRDGPVPAPPAARRSTKQLDEPKRPGLFATTSYTTNISNEGEDLDVETTMVNVVLDNKDHSVWGYIKKVNDTTFTNYATTYKTGASSSTYQAMDIPTDYDYAVDPVLTANPYTSGEDPKRVYYVGLLAQNASNGAPSAISVQFSDDGGFNWDDVVEIDRSDTTGIKLDKPDATVSYYSQTRGYVYACYTELELSPSSDSYGAEILVTRSENGGETWTSPVSVTEGRVHACQIAHSTAYNRVYLSWINWDDDTIEYATSDNKGVTWSSIETASNAWLKGPENRDMDYLLGGSFTIPQMRFDSTNWQVELVWHESEYGTTGTHTGDDNDDQYLEDSSADFTTLGVQAGDYVRNTSNDAYTFVDSVISSTKLELDRFSWNNSEGAEEDFDNGDSYVLKARNTDIYFVRKTSSGWKSKKQLNVATGNDQIQPSIDFSNSWNQLVIGYLDRSHDTANPNKTYRAAWIETRNSGNKLDSGLVYDYLTTDPTTSPHSGGGLGFIGDYTDTWFWPYTDFYGSRFHFVWPGEDTYWDGFASAID